MKKFPIILHRRKHTESKYVITFGSQHFSEDFFATKFVLLFIRHKRMLVIAISREKADIFSVPTWMDNCDDFDLKP